MTPSSSSKDKFFEKVINPYLPDVLKHAQTIEMHEEVLNIHDMQGQKKEGSKKARFATLEREIFKCQGMVERGLSGNNFMITEFIHENKMDARNVGEAFSSFKSGLNIPKLKSLICKTEIVSMNRCLRG
ncbi:hypothetical protein D1007_33465 [Hordeum vulgare]|nr:hypothetical protein D1007_33465 [Hordeum vulgare]